MGPERNLSWALQCALLADGSAPVLPDERVRAVVAVSPPARLLFDAESSQGLQAPGLVVSGTRDWVVPSGPEAITPFSLAGAAGKGHRLVLAQGGDHFNLRAPDPAQKAALGRVILAWMQAHLAPAAQERSPGTGSLMFSEKAWGDPELPLVDVTERL